MISAFDLESHFLRTMAVPSGAAIVYYFRLQALMVCSINERYGVVPADGNDAHRSLRCGVKLDSIMRIRAERVLSNDYT